MQLIAQTVLWCVIYNILHILTVSYAALNNDYFEWFNLLIFCEIFATFAYVKTLMTGFDCFLNAKCLSALQNVEILK